MRGLIYIVMSAFLGGMTLTGCASSKQETPRVYERQVQLDELVAAAGVDNACVLRQQAHTAGRFTCSLAIAKYVPGECAGNSRLSTMTNMEEAAWVEAVRGLIELNDLQFISPLSIVPGEASVESLCAAAQRRRAKLLLIYLPNRYGPNSAQVLGALYDTQTCQPAAILHSSAQYLDEEGVESDLDGSEGVWRDRDAYYQASRDCEKKVVQCLGTLIQKDAPPPTTQPHGWRTPSSERWWVP